MNLLNYCLLVIGFASLYANAELIGQTIELQSRRVERSSGLRRNVNGQSRIQRRSKGLANIPLQDYFVETDLQWYGDIAIGTPLQHLTVLFDTGSPDLEIASTLCGESCAHQKKFDPSKSSTFVNLNATGLIIFATGTGVDPVIGDNYSLDLLLALDTVSVAGIAVENTFFGLITNQTAKFEPDPFDGILGLAAIPDGWLAGAIEKGLPALYGFYLTPLIVGNAELTLGGIDYSKIQGDITYTAIVPNSLTWNSVPSRVFANGKELNSPLDGLQIIFDSGTSNVYFPPNITEAIYALISPEIKPFPGEADTYGIPCALIPTIPLEFSVQFTDESENPFNLTIPRSELNVGPFRSNPSICQTFINVFDPSFGYFGILGGTLMKHYYTIFDGANQRLGFAKTR